MIPQKIKKILIKMKTRWARLGLKQSLLRKITNVYIWILIDASILCINDGSKSKFLWEIPLEKFNSKGLFKINNKLFQNNQIG